MILLTVLEAVNFFRDVDAYSHHALAEMTMLGAAIRLVASLGVVVFLFVFHRSQRRTLF
jgi:hypothetical protein